MIGVKSKAPFSPNLVFILGFVNRRQDGRSGVHVHGLDFGIIFLKGLDGPIAYHEFLAIIWSVSVVVLSLGVQLTYSSTFRIVIYFFFLNGSLERRKDSKGLTDWLFACYCTTCLSLSDPSPTYAASLLNGRSGVSTTGHQYWPK